MKLGNIASPKGKLLRFGVAGLFGLTAFLLIGSLLYAAPGEGAVLRSRVYKIVNLTASQVKTYLEDLKIGSKIEALSDKVLIVSSDVPGDLTRASSLIEMLDTKEPRLIRAWEPSPTGFPPLGTITGELKNVTLGTFLDSPGATAPNPLLVDIQADKLVAIGSAELISRIDALYTEWRKKQTPEAVNGPEDKAEAAVVEPNISLVELVGALMPGAPEKELQAAPVTEPNEARMATEALEAAEAPEPAAGTMEEVAAESPEGDFFTEELLAALASEEKKAADLEQQIQAQKAQQTAETAAAEPEPAVETPVVEPEETPAEGPEDAGERSLLDILKSLQQQQNAQAAEEEKQARPTSPAPEKIATAPAPSELAAAAAGSKDEYLARMEQQLALAQQQIAELKDLIMAQAAAKDKQPQTPPADPYKDIRTMSEPVIPGGEEELDTTLALPEQVELIQLIELVGKQLGLNYMYDPAQINSNIRVQLKLHEGKIKVKDVYALLESVMRFRGFIMTRRGNLVTIVPQTQITQVDPGIIGPDETIKPGDVIVSSVFQLQNITPAAAQTMLTQMKLGTGYVQVQETGSLIVTDYAYRMEQIQKVIRLVDVPGEPKQFKHRMIEYMTAAEMVTKLQALTAKMEGVSVSGGSPAAPAAAQPTTPQRIDPRTRRPVPQPAQPTQPAAAAQPSAGSLLAEKETVYLQTDDRTNRILMIGYPDQIETINELIDTLDVAGYNLRYVKEYIIQNVEASEIINALNELGLAQVSVSSQSAQSPVQRAAPARPGQPPQPQAAPAQTTASAGSDQPYISIRPNTNSLLVNATKEQHEAIELVIAHVDVEQKDQRRIEEYEIQNVGAADVVATLENLGIVPSGTGGQSQSSTSRTGRSTVQQRSAAAVQPGQPAQPETGPIFLPTAEGETVRDLTAGYPQVAILESTNSLLVNATPRQHAAISLVIAHVDRTLESVSTPYVVYPLENQDPEELAAVLNELIQETIDQAQKSAPDAKIQTGVPSTALLPTREEERIQIIADPASYSLIVYANKKNQLWVRELISQLDEYRPQVLLDCTLVEITQQDDFNYDLNILASIPDLNYTSGTTNIAGVNRQSILDALQDAPDRNKFIDFAVDSGKLTGFFGNEKIMALFTAMQEKKYGRILAKPKILVDDNQEGKIETKTTTYIQRDIIQNQVPDQGPPINYTETRFEPYDATILLSIKPHISKGDNLRLEIELSRTDFLNFEANSDRPPNQATSNVNSVVTLPDGSTVILGGLDKINQGKGGTKVPILGDIPLIGGLFRSTTNTSQQNKLYVFVKANILRPGMDMTSEDLKNISRKYRAEFEEREDEMQRYDDWPGIPPKPMDPKNVLEMDE